MKIIARRGTIGQEQGVEIERSAGQSLSPGKNIRHLSGIWYSGSPAEMVLSNSDRATRGEILASQRGEQTSEEGILPENRSRFSRKG